MSKTAMDVKKLKETLVGAGIEVYRTRPSEIHIAERVRLHIMDSGIRVLVGDALRVQFTARSQRSDFPDDVSPDALFERVRRKIGTDALARGYVETGSETTAVRDPMNAERVLDVWHEITYAKDTDDPNAAIDEIRWALSLERYVPPE
jgi:hypothetical protein